MVHRGVRLQHRRRRALPADSGGEREESRLRGPPQPQPGRHAQRRVAKLRLELEEVHEQPLHRRRVLGAPGARAMAALAYEPASPELPLMRRLRVARMVEKRMATTQPSKTFG